MAERKEAADAQLKLDAKQREIGHIEDADLKEMDSIAAGEALGRV